jgi:uncharacterized protein YjiS (DUF1127 family)
MSTTKPAPAHSAVARWLRLAQPAGYLAAMAARAVALAIVRRAASQAQRELVALDNRTLADIGPARAELTSLIDAVAETRTAAVLAQFPWNCPRTGA